LIETLFAVIILFPSSEKKSSKLRLRAEKHFYGISILYRLNSVRSRILLQYSIIFKKKKKKKKNAEKFFFLSLQRKTTFKAV